MGMKVGVYDGKVETDYSQVMLKMRLNFLFRPIMLNIFTID